MTTHVGDSTDDFGRSVAQSKLETKVRADFEIQGWMRDWILIVRPFQKIVAEHADLMVHQGVMTTEESVHWLNMHWELICAHARDVADGCCIAAYGRERQTRVVVHVKKQAFAGYERIRLKAETFLLARAGAGEDERDLDELSVAGVSQRRAEQAEALPSPDAASESPAIGGGDEEDFIFGHMEPDEEYVDRSKRPLDVGELWVKVEMDDEFYETVLEAWGVLKEEKQERHLAMAEEAVAIALGREGDEAGEESGEEESAAEEDDEEDAERGLTPIQRDTLQMQAQATLAAKEGREPGRWWEASALGPSRGKSGVARDFRLKVGGREFRVHANATKHMEEHSNSKSAERPGHEGRRDASVDFPISSLAAALESIMEKLTSADPGRISATTSSWELGVDTKDTPWCVYHAVPKGGKK
jgi:hypothetical protein